VSEWNIARSVAVLAGCLPAAAAAGATVTETGAAGCCRLLQVAFDSTKLMMSGYNFFSAFITAHHLIVSKY
jgi:hypothetical protein